MPAPTAARRGSHLTRLGLLTIVAVVMGVVVAAVALPVAGMFGLVARDGVGAVDFGDLPPELQQPPLAQRSIIYAADGTTQLASFYYENRHSVTLDEIAPIMRKAIVAVEDVRFYDHGGVDPKGTLRALITDIKGGAIQGGSTITQQYVKNALIETAASEGDAAGIAAAREQTLARKLREARYALALEQKLSKDEILQRYLNTVYFGSGAYGIEAAAQHYFSVPASKLSLTQAAFLAGLVQNPPANFDPKHGKRELDRRNTVLSRMVDAGYITPAQGQAAVASPLGAKLQRVPNGCVGSIAPFFCDYVQHEILLNPAFGATTADRTKLLLRGGLRIYTTLDITAQSSAQQAVEHYIPSDPSKNGGIATAVVMMEPGTGQIKAMAINRKYGAGPGETMVNYAVDRAHGNSGTGRAAGSTFKVFTLAAALQQGIPVSYTIHAPNKAHIAVGSETDCSGAPIPSKHDGPWEPGNDQPGEGGTYTLEQATWKSINTYYALLEQKVGVCPSVTVAKDMGVTLTNGKPLKEIPSFVLGTEAVDPLHVANAFATLAARGTYCPPVAVTRVTEVEEGKTKDIPVPKSQCTQAIEPKIADAVSSILEGVITQGTAKGYGIGRPAAGKTGTDDFFKNAWFTGYTPNLATSVWVGNPKGNVSMTGSVINGRHYGKVYGSTLPAPIWQMAMKGAVKNLPTRGFVPPDPEVLRGKTTPLPDVVGLTQDAATTALQSQGFNVVVDPNPQPSSEFAAGVVMATSPAAGTELALGETVTLYLSSGIAPEPTTSPGASPTPTPSGEPGDGGEPNPTTPPSGPPASPGGILGGDGPGGQGHGQGHGKVKP